MRNLINRRSRYLYSIIISSLLGSFNLHAQVQLKTYTFKQQHYLVYCVEDFSTLRLGLYNKKGSLLGSFSAWQRELSKRTQLQFAMNAGMFHPTYQPVGLYIEEGQQKQPLNTEKQSFGNFFVQPNGVLIWNRYQAQIITTQQWQQRPWRAEYATQSGPMLVIDGNINSKLTPQSQSAKIRNGVGIRQGKLYFVISENRVNLYQFAKFFQRGLGTDQALYLDGSISSVYDRTTGRNDQAFKLGPMIGVVKTP